MGNWERRLIETEIERGSLADLLEIDEFIDERVFLTRDGFPGVVAELEPAAFECLDPIDLDQIARGFERQLRNLDQECRVYQYFCKQGNASIAGASPVSASRRSFVEECSLYSVRVFLAIVQETAPLSRSRANIEREIRANAQTLLRSVEATLAGLVGISGRVLDRAGAFGLFRRLLNFDPILQTRQLDTDDDLAWQSCCSSIDVSTLPRLGRHYFRVFALKNPPENTHANMLGKLLELPGNIIAALDWKLLPAAQTQSVLQTAKAHHNKTKSRMSNFGIGKKEIREGEVLVHGGKQALIDELEQCQRDIEIHGVRFGRLAPTVIIYDEDPLALRSLAAQVESVFLTCRAAVTELTERAALVAFLSLIPGNHRYSIRTLTVSDVNYADMSFLFTAAQGKQRNDFLRDEYLTVGENRWRTPFYLNLHAAEIGHSCITGIPGSGKSFLGNHLIGQYQKYRPRTVIFDVARSFRTLTAQYGGSYVEVGRPDRGARIAPFCLQPTQENIDFLFSLVRMLIESDHGAPLTSEDAVTLYREIERVYRLPKRTLGVLAAGLPASLASRLARWVRRRHMNGEQVGQYAYLFDNEEDSLTFADFQTFDFPDLTQSPEAIEALMFYVLHLTNRRVQQSDRPSLVVMDEAWQFVRHEATRRYVEQAMKTWRKYNGVMVLITHSLHDIEGVRPIIEACATYIHGHNPRIDEQAWMDVFKLKRTETELIKALRTPQPGDPNAYAEFLVQGQGVFVLRESERARWAYSNSAHTNKHREEAIRAAGSVEAALEAIGATR